MTQNETIQYFTHLFPEWLICDALARSIKENPTLPTSLPFHNSGQTRSLGEIFPEIGAFHFDPEKQLEKEEYLKYGIDKEIYFKQFWSLRPDFMLYAEGSKCLILFEAKVYIPNKTWNDLKERKYFEFLKQAKDFKRRGLFFIVPKKTESQCKECINSIFETLPEIQTGYGIWEEMLGFISNSINEVFIEWLFFQTEGIKLLTQWKKNQQRNGNRP